MAEQPDTPVQPPPSTLEKVKSFIGDLARPFAIYAVSAATGWAIMKLADKVGGSDAAIFIGAVLAGVGAIYWGKSWENARTGKADAEIAIAQAQTPAQPSPPPEADELPPDQRVRR